MGQVNREIVQYKAALLATLISSVALVALLVTLPTLYSKLNNAQERLAKRMQSFRVRYLWGTEREFRRAWSFLGHIRWNLGRSEHHSN